MEPTNELLQFLARPAGGSMAHTSLMCCQVSEALWETGNITLGLTGLTPCRSASTAFQLKQFFIYSDKTLRKCFVKIFLLSLMNNSGSFKRVRVVRSSEVAPFHPFAGGSSVLSHWQTPGPRDLLKWASPRGSQRCRDSR